MYCIDTSSLIQGWRRDYPPDIFHSLWEQLDQLIKQDRLFSSIEVLLELERGGDDIFEWAKERKQIFLEADEEVQSTLTSIVDKFPSFIPDDSHDGIWADAYLIALTQTKNWVLITGEKPVGPGSKRLRIPNVCQILDVECINLLQLIRREGWHF